MKQLGILFICIAGLVSVQAHAAGGDDPLLFSGSFEQFEMQQEGAEQAVAWNGAFWIGKDLNKLYLKTEGEALDGVIEDMELQILYSRAVSPYWDMQFGLRQDTHPTVSRNYLALGYMGVAPYFIESDIGLFYDVDTGQGSFRLDAEYEMMFTQRLVLIPELEMNIFAQDDVETRTGAGLSNLSFGLRLAYEIRREFAPYIGVNWWQKFGQTARYASADGKETSATQLVAGVRFWF